MRHTQERPETVCGIQLVDGLSATDSVSLSSDGPIPDKVWRAAAAYDRTQRQKQARQTARAARVRLGNVRLHPDLVVDMMVQIICDMMLKWGNVTVADFERNGIDTRTMNQHWDKAIAKARLADPRLFAEVA